MPDDRPGPSPGPSPGHSHSHQHRQAPSVEVGALPRTLLLVSLALMAVATVIGLVGLWPDDSRLADIRGSLDYAAPGVTFPDGRVVEVQPACDATVRPGPDDRCGTISADVTTGDGAGETVQMRVAPQVSASLRVGDDVRLLRTPPGPGADAEASTYNYVTTQRNAPVGWLVLAFVLLVVVVARVRGVMALIGLGISGVVIWKFMLPALLLGGPGTAIALTTAAAIMFVVLYSTHGVSLRTSVALAGTLAGIGVTALMGVVAVGTTRLTGVADDTGGQLTAVAGDVNFQGLLQCGVIIAALGVLNDVTITQASSVWELRAASPELSRRQVYASAMRIGRDHIASTIYTIVFAYAGTALLVLLLLLVYNQPFLDLVSSEELAEEIVRTITSGIGLVLAVPLTTALAALIASPGRSPVRRRAGSEAGSEDEEPDFWGRWR